MTNNTIEHQGIVEKIQNSQIYVRIIQVSACATCSVKGHCSSADSKDKVIEITDKAAASLYKVGDQVKLVGRTSQGMRAVILAFVIPFVIIVFFLFLFMNATGDELSSALLSLATLIPYYSILYFFRTRLKQQFLFTIKPIN